MDREDRAVDIVGLEEAADFGVAAIKVGSNEVLQE